MEDTINIDTTVHEKNITYPTAIQAGQSDNQLVKQDFQSPWHSTKTQLHQGSEITTFGHSALSPCEDLALFV